MKNGIDISSNLKQALTLWKSVAHILNKRNNCCSGINLGEVLKAEVIFILPLFPLLVCFKNNKKLNQACVVRLHPGIRVDLSYSSFKNTGQSDLFALLYVILISHLFIFLIST